MGIEEKSRELLEQLRKDYENLESQLFTLEATEEDWEREFDETGSADPFEKLERTVKKIQRFNLFRREFTL